MNICNISHITAIISKFTLNIPKYSTENEMVAFEMRDGATNVISK